MNIDLVHALVAEQCTSTPQTVAVRCPRKELTYRELNGRANQLAHHLQSIGVGPNAPVAMCMNSSCEAVVALLGIFKAGAMAVPVDLSGPSQRLEYVFGSMGTEAVVCDAEVAPSARLRHGRVIVLEEHSIGSEREDEPNKSVEPDRPALRLAHGRRWITIEYRALAARAHAFGRALDLARDDTLLVATSFGHRAVSWEALAILCHGGTLLLGSEQVGASLAVPIIEGRVTAACVDPRQLRWLRERVPEAVDAFAKLRVLACDGRMSEPEVEWCLRGNGTSTYELYCPPETGTVLARAIADDRVKVLATVRVLDRNLQLLPIGAPGELHVGGAGLAREYFGHALATAERFVSDPFADGRLFRTGDMGRRRKDRGVDLTGTVRAQVWNDGARVDLDAVETALLEDPSVVSCTVRARKPDAASTLLVAYVVSAGRWSRSDLDAHLADRLPAEWRPNAYAPVRTMPYTSTGQVDDRALGELPLIDEQLVATWEERLKSSFGTSEVAVLAQERLELPSRWHLDDLCPKADAPAATSRVESPPSAEPGDARSRSVRRPAVVEGPSLPEDAGIRTLADMLVRAAAGSESVIHIRTDGSEARQSYRSLLEEAGRILGGLRRLALTPGSSVIFQLASSEDFVPALWACFLGGFVPVPLSVAASHDAHDATAMLLRGAWTLLDRPIVITSEAIATRVALERGGEHDARVVSIAELRNAPPESAYHPGGADDLALILFTSGSTGVPKGVMQPQRNLLAASAAIASANGFSAQDISLNWIPLDHVGSLVATHLRCVRFGSRQVLAAREFILGSPLRWLDLIDRYRATDTWAPNFAYGMVNEMADEIATRRWDLASMRVAICAGEAVRVETVRRFLGLLGPHGFPATAIRPAWGMSETCSGASYSDQFGSETSPARFVDVGPPVPSIGARIVDENDNLLEEGRIGRLQVRGATVTTGYIHHDEATRQAFTNDGWFKTGDLALIEDGRITISGREKDVIIVNGQNHHPHEVEAAVEGLPTVSASYVGACGVRDAVTDTDQLAIFFHTSATHDAELAALLGEIRGEVSRRFGINPQYLVPVEKDEIPKTSIGKVQRSRLAERFESGEFAATLRRVDLLAGTSNTMPDWFFRKVWLRREAGPRDWSVGSSWSLIVLDRGGLGEELAARLRAVGHRCITVADDAEFAACGGDHYRCRVDEKSHYRQIFETLAADSHPCVQRTRDDLPKVGQPLDRLIYLAPYDTETPPVGSVAELRSAQGRIVHGVVAVTQALAESARSEARIRLCVVSSHAIAASEGDPVRCEQSTLPGLIKSIALELPYVTPVHVDLEPAPPAKNAALLLDELQTVGAEPEVAFRSSRRLVPKLSKIDMLAEPVRGTSLKEGGVYLVTGGLGQLGVHVSRFLAERYRAKLVIVGRTDLPERSTWTSEIERRGPAAERIARYLKIEAGGGEVAYEVADVSNLGQLKDVVTRAEAKWQAPLDGVFHLASAQVDQDFDWKKIAKHTVLAEEREAFEQMFRAKVYGTWALGELLRERPDATLVCFSSISAILGGTGLSAYSAGNSFIEGATYHLRRSGHPRTYCVHWPLWDDPSLNTSPQAREAAARVVGCSLLSVEQGLNVLLAVLQRDIAACSIGLDQNSPRIRSEWVGGGLEAQELFAYVVAAGPLPDGTVDLDVRDCLGRKTYCRPISVNNLPRTAGGTIDQRALADLSHNRHARQKQRTPPRTDCEQRIRAIWQEVLKVSDLCIEDNFFGLGGTSILVTRVTGAIRREFNVDVPVSLLFEASTLEAFARSIESACQGSLERHPQPALASVHEPGEGSIAHHPYGETAVDSGSGIPLSFEQEYFHQQHLHGLDDVMFIPIVLGLRGPLEADLLEKAIRELVRRYDILRTVFPVMDGEVSQSVCAHEHEYVTRSSLEGLPELERADDLRRILRELRAEVGNLETGPCFRAVILRVGPQEHRLIVGTHHIIWDAFSFAIFLAELSSLYSSLRRGSPLDQRTPRQYAAYARSQRQDLRGAALQDRLSYYRERLVGAPETRLDTSSSATREAWRHIAELTEDLTEELVRFGKAVHAPLSAVLLAALKALVSRHSDTPVVRVIHAQRDDDFTTSLLGPVLSSLLIRTDAVSGLSFGTLVCQVRDAVLSAMHQPLPDSCLPLIVPGRRFDRIVFDYIPEGTLNPGLLPGVEAELLPTESFTNRWYDSDLFLVAHKPNQRIVIALITSAGVTDQQGTALLARQLLALLAAAVRNPDEVVARLATAT